MRVKPRILFRIAARSFKNDLLKRISVLFDKCLFGPPNFIEVRLTLRCNLRCLQCDDWKLNSSELTTQFWKKTILDIKRFIGPYFIRFYGGEPFLRTDLLELINLCFRNDIPTLITTNGTLISKAVADRLAKNNVVLINISLDGFKAETHDYLRGVEGTYEKVMQAIYYLQGKVPIQIDTTITDENLDEILDLAEFAYKNNLQISFQGYFDKKYITESSNSKGGACSSPRDLAKLDYVIDELCRRKKYNKSIVDSYIQLKRFKLFYHNSLRFEKKYCEAIGARLMVKQQGNITLCSYSGPIGAIGNLADRSLKDIWRSEETIKKIKEMKNCKVKECIAMRGSHKENYLEKIAKIKRNIFTV